jgi:hypothetical protein
LNGIQTQDPSVRATKTNAPDRAATTTGLLQLCEVQIRQRLIIHSRLFHEAIAIIMGTATAIAAATSTAIAAAVTASDNSVATIS